ncbi:MAG: hypothetical protein KH420_10140, partial [Clostridiales bacterium]|nr:hypothetical protein [Clostridiales bacterium]
FFFIENHPLYKSVPSHYKGVGFRKPVLRPRLIAKRRNFCRLGMEKFVKTWYYNNGQPDKLIYKKVHLFVKTPVLQRRLAI